MVGYGVGFKVAGKPKPEPLPDPAGLIESENGAGLGACARNTQPTKNARKLIIPNQIRIPPLSIFIISDRILVY